MSGKPVTVRRELRRDKAECPNLPKGQRCAVCGGTYICLRSDLPKAGKSSKAPEGDKR